MKLGKILAFPSSRIELLSCKGNLRQAERAVARKIIGHVHSALLAVILSATRSIDLPGPESDRLTPALQWSAFDLGSARARLRGAHALTQEALAQYEMTMLTALE